MRAEALDLLRRIANLRGMKWFRKRQLAGLVAVAAWLVPTISPAQAPQEVVAPPAATPDPAARLDGLFTELAEPGREDWERIEGEITTIWSRSGSPAMDLLLQRGNEALEAEDYATALEHFSALTDHAPDFAEGWNARATTFYLLGEYSLSIADVERVLALEPRHFGAIAGLGFMLEAMGQPELALRALHEVQKLNPNRPTINEAVTRLERMTGEVEL
jgi:tetratricopeptide (TPR) repeat protein